MHILPASGNICNHDGGGGGRLGLNISRLGFLPRSAWNKQTRIRSPSPSHAKFCDGPPPPPPALWDPPQPPTPGRAANRCCWGSRLSAAPIKGALQNAQSVLPERPFLETPLPFFEAFPETSFPVRGPARLPRRASVYNQSEHISCRAYVDFRWREKQGGFLRLAQ